MASIEDVNDEAHAKCQVNVQGSLQSAASDWPRPTSPLGPTFYPSFTLSPHSSGLLKHRFVLHMIDGIT
jgi:hypothetical protein